MRFNYELAALWATLLPPGAGLWLKNSGPSFLLRAFWIALLSSALKAIWPDTRFQYFVKETAPARYIYQADLSKLSIFFVYIHRPGFLYCCRPTKRTKFWTACPSALDPPTRGRVLRMDRKIGDDSSARDDPRFLNSSSHALFTRTRSSPRKEKLYDVQALQSKVLDYQRENAALHRELELRETKLSSCMRSFELFWSPELTKEREARKQDGDRLAVVTAECDSLRERLKVQTPVDIVVTLK